MGKGRVAAYIDRSCGRYAHSQGNVMLNHPLRLRVLALAAGLALLAFSGWASADPPSRVARLGYMTGAVSFSPAGEDDWVRAAINRPLTTGDRLWTDAGARAEIQVGGAMIRMGAGTGVSVLNLDDRIAQLQLTQGTLNVRVRRLGPGQSFEVDTPNLAFTLQATRRIPDRRGSRRQRDDDRRAPGPGRGLRRRRVVRDRFAATLSIHRHRPARVRRMSMHRAPTTSIAGPAIATAPTTTRTPPAMCRRT